MKRLLRWIGVGLGSIAGLAIVAYAVVYVLSERVLQHTYAVPTVAISVPPEAFTQLMREGVALGGRNLTTMSPWARKLLSHLTDSEIAALYSYLHTMPEAAHK